MSNEFTTDRVSSDMINMMAKQMGAVHIKSDSAYINIYTFKIGEDLRIKYMLDLRRGKGMYLHRVSPYPIMLGKFYGETDIIDYIRRDLQKFQNAYNSEKFEHFLELTEELTQFNRQIEQLFLNRNVPEAAFRELADELKEVRGTIEQIGEECPMLYDNDRTIGELTVDASDLGEEE
ncbi:MAG: hypothetical protein Q4C18_02435 [Eubacteriales bacterium]|nr:hypothetical protein [Eubacteriales bacterium]